jgi:hypothetical protein
MSLCTSSTIHTNSLPRMSEVTDQLDQVRGGAFGAKQPSSKVSERGGAAVSGMFEGGRTKRAEGRRHKVKAAKPPHQHIQPP